MGEYFIQIVAKVAGMSIIERRAYLTMLLIMVALRRPGCDPHIMVATLSVLCALLAPSPSAPLLGQRVCAPALVSNPQNACFQRRNYDGFN